MKNSAIVMRLVDADDNIKKLVRAEYPDNKWVITSKDDKGRYAAQLMASRLTFMSYEVVYDDHRGLCIVA